MSHTFAYIAGLLTAKPMILIIGIFIGFFIGLYVTIFALVRLKKIKR